LERQSVAVRQEAELTELRSEREIVAAAQAAVDEKARVLVDAREAVARERAALAAERAEGCTAEEVQRLKSTEALSDERETLEGWRTDLRAEEVRLREEAVKVRQEQIRFEMDRQQLREISTCCGSKRPICDLMSGNCARWARRPRPAACAAQRPARPAIPSSAIPPWRRHGPGLTGRWTCWKPSGEISPAKSWF